MNWNEIRKLAVKQGFVLYKHRGKHDEYYNPVTGKTILLERHWSQEVRSGLMNRLKKEMGI
ncbi:MAG: type II toxin-antitoxin system HicA family toxin [Porphyromonadaceae bacterium]|nr:type II toxin-antitoxin system HicA family toxin [Porphyromonadaceae bacterium]